MDLYSTALFIHVTAALAMGAMMGVMTVAEAAITRADELQKLRMLGGFLNRAAVVIKTVAIFLLLSGLYLVHLRWEFSAPWIVAALITFVYLASTGPLVFQRRLNAAVEAAARAAGITSTVREQLDDQLLVWMGGIRIGLFVFLAFIMTIKPALPLLLAAALAALALGTLIAARYRARTRAMRTVR